MFVLKKWHEHFEHILWGRCGQSGWGQRPCQLAQVAMKNLQLMQVAASMLSADNKHGGLAGLMG